MSRQAYQRLIKTGVSSTVNEDSQLGSSYNRSENVNFTVKQFLELLDYKTNDSAEYYDHTLGAPLWITGFWNEKHGDGGFSFECVYNTKTWEVVQLEAHDFTRHRSYRWNPEHLRKNRDVYAYDEVKYIDLETTEDFVEKVQGIQSGVDYDTRVSIPVEFTDLEFLKIAKMAHSHDMTFNQFVEYAVKLKLDIEKFC